MPSCAAVFRAVLLAALLPLALPAEGVTQALYSPDRGVYLTVSPLEERLLRSPQTLVMGGAGARLSARTDIAMRAGRFRDVPHGNPLPITYVGYTYIEGVLRHLVPLDEAGSGVRLSITPNATLVDRSFPVSDLEEGVSFREGRRTAEVGVTLEALRYWEVEVGDGLLMYPMVGGSLEYHDVRDSLLQHPDGQVGTIQGDSRRTPMLGMALPIVFQLGARPRVVVEPSVRVPLALPSIYGFPPPQVGLSVHLNL